MIDRAFGEALGKLLDAHLRVQEQRRNTVSRVATGAAFEGWLSIETRLQMEHHRNQLKLTGTVDDLGQTVDKFWICNEYNKVDLGVLEHDNEEDRWVAAIEFKLITNNKNWPAKCEGIRADLSPRPGTKKHAIRPTRGRFAVVAVMGKVFRNPGPHGWKTDLPAWEAALWKDLLPTKGPRQSKLERLWRSPKRFRLVDCHLKAGYDHFLDLHVLARA